MFIDLLESIATLALIGVVIFIASVYISLRVGKLNLYKRFIDDFKEREMVCDFWKILHPNLSFDDALRKYYSDRGNYKRAMVKFKERADKERKEKSIRRVFAYQYEDFIFSLFSPLAIYNEKKDLWFLPRDSALTKSYILHEIVKRMSLSYSEAEDVFQKFIDNRIIYQFNSTKYALSETLTQDAQVINETDMDINKWIHKYGQSMTKDSLMKYVESHLFHINVDDLKDLGIV